ncbi:hypothetical protein LH464_21385 [Neorhizobium sp. T786]|uniref:hypothetical protein n=1 Tax=Pseudorhizobium xiangyangii TaxID=2883104 RepID=UPI001D000BD0|nr:hypothetical protein [Neorhizobium xiangyangii]MCB5205023.1 hypothetical protein [Neorhizobium xiangyangii]
MTEDQIIEIFVKAAQVDRKLPDTARPASLKAINHGYVHDTADINGWDEATKNAEWRWKWLNPDNLRNTTNDIGIWEAAMEIIKLIPDPAKRRALWAWAKSEGGGKSFAKWCKNEEGISRQLGDWRRKSAIACVVATFQGKPLQHNEYEQSDDLPNQPENEHIKPMIEVWRADDAKPICGFDEDLRDFSWADAQNARRRQREAKRREAA